MRVPEIIRFIGRSSKRIAVTAVGAAFVLAGLAMLVLPGPGILVVALGFGVLAITLHDAVFDRPEVFDDAAAMGILLIPAAEMRIEGADIIRVTLPNAWLAVGDARSAVMTVIPLLRSTVAPIAAAASDARAIRPHHAAGRSAPSTTNGQSVSGR